ncbi:MAG: SusC/RagA family TonB-linked outer membrane protein [Bacteroidales bacterium]|nr:SusC/RagA family TonB-linked outer membrane protein [Bacteroidales bacterium]
MQSAKISVSGTVRDASGQPVPGAGIFEKGTTNGTVSGADGRFSLTVESDAVLVVSCIGYLSQEIPVTGTRMDVVLEEDKELLEEVVVIGYGETTRKNFTGSVAKVEMKDSPLAMVSSSNAYNLLNGTASGVYVTQNGYAGSTPSIQVRGQRSIGGNSSPLLVVDGVIFSGSINDIDVQTIESISVLKDASTLASYGTRAANGVIMITTKRGEKGKPVIEFSPSVSLSSVGYKPRMRSAEGYKELMNLRSGLDPKADPSWMSDLERANYNSGELTDWMDYVTRTGVLQNYTLSFSGATDNSNYYLSFNHWDQQAPYYGDNYKRNTLNIKVSTKVSKYIEIGANANLAFNSSDGVRPSYGTAVTMSPFGEPLLKNGNMRKYPDGKEVTTVNPLWNTFNGVDSESRGSSQVMGGFLNIKIPWIEGLSYRVTGTYTRRNSESTYFTHENNFPDINYGDDGYTQEIYNKQLINTGGSISSSRTNTWVLDNILTYNRTFGAHFVNATLVYTRDESVSEGKTMTGSDFTGVGNTILGVYGLPNAEVQKISSITNVRTANIGYLARLNYSYADKYHLNAAVRRDGASVFGENKKWGVFPSVGVAWSLGREDFMKGIGFLDDLKLKLSWGKNGNQSISAYSTLSPVSMGRNGRNIYYFDNKVSYGQRINSIGNPDLGWEETTSLNGGFETSMFRGRLSADVNVYKSKTVNQIFPRTIAPMSSGMTSQQATMGRIDN